MWAGTNDDVRLDVVEVRDGADIELWPDVLACLPASVVRKKGAFDKGHATAFEVGRPDFVPWSKDAPQLVVKATLGGGDKWQVASVVLEELATGRVFTCEPEGGPAWLSSKAATARLVARETKVGIAREDAAGETAEVGGGEPSSAKKPTAKDDDAVVSPLSLPEGWEVTRFAMGGKVTEYYSNPSTGETADTLEQIPRPSP